jgi:hypothetical protein
MLMEYFEHLLYTREPLGGVRARGGEEWYSPWQGYRVASNCPVIISCFDGALSIVLRFNLASIIYMSEAWTRHVVTPVIEPEREANSGDTASNLMSVKLQVCWSMLQNNCFQWLLISILLENVYLQCKV